MKLFGDARVLRGSIAWTNPLRLSVTVVEPPDAPPATAEPAEFDEDGRRYVFRYAAAAPKPCSIDRDRIFEYVKRRRLPSEAERSYRRDVRNAGDFFEDVRDIQTHYDVEDV
jgi:hypothetical protein